MPEQFLEIPLDRKDPCTYIVCMAEKTQAELEAAAISRLGALLVQQRWSKATKADRKKVGKMLAEARKAKRRKK